MLDYYQDDDLEVLSYAHGLISTSKDDTSSDVADPIAASMAPIQLDHESMKDYMGHFFPTRRKSASPGGPTGNDFQKLIPELAKVSYGISKFFVFAQYCLANGSILEDMDRSDMIANLTSISNTLNQDLDPGEVKNYLTVVSSVLSQAQHHVVVDSQRYKGGKDVVFSGIPGSQKGLKGGIHLRATPIAEIQVSRSEATEGFYEQERLGNYSTDLSLKVLEACELVHKELFGEATTFTKQDLRKVHQKRWEYDFEALNQKVADILGLPIDLGFFSNPDEALVKKFGKYMSLVCIREINKNVAREWAYYLTHQDGTQKPDNSKLITKEGMLAAVNFGITYAINLPSEYVNYISQSESGELSLYALHTWVTSWSKYYVRPSGSSTGGMKQKYLPRYIVPASRTSNLVAERKKAGYYTDEGRSGEDNLTVGPLGSLMYVPNQSDADFDNAKAYEASMEELIRKSYEHGAPVTSNVTLTEEQIAASGVADAESSIRAQKEKLEEFKGTVLSYSWDYNTVLTVGGSDSFKQNNIDLQGATVPDALTISDYLGFDFSEEGERPIVKDFADSMALMMLHIKPDEGEFISPDMIKYGYWSDDPESGFLGFPPFSALFRTYTYMAIRKKVPDIPTLIEQAAKELSITTLDGNPFEREMYKSLIRNDLSLQAYDVIKTGEMIKRFLSYAVKDAEANPGSNLRAEVMNEIGPESFDVEIKDHPRYFDKRKSTMADFGNVYAYLGGRIFQMACQALTKVSSKDLMTQNFEGIEGLLKDVTLPSFQTISMEVMPLASMLGNMVPKATEYFEKAEAIIDSYRKDESIDADDIIMPGLAEGSQMFPHQIDIHRTLRKRPKFATIDVAPGGGKTISLLVDIGCVQNEDPEGIKALVLCPDHLVGNWCEDMTKVTKGSWNVVPLKTEVWRRWGDEALADKIKNAPPNTVFVAGLNFVKSKPFLLSYGTKSVHVSGMVEFLKRFGFNYIALDESHKCKNLASITHKAVKQLTTLSNVKYVRLATGTLVHKDITDVIGQSALYSSHIFRTQNVFNYEFDSSANDSAARVRSKLANHSAVITKKKKEWAFMLPNPIDILVKTSIADPSNPGSEIHYEVYNAVLNDVVDQLEKEINDKRRKAALEAEGAAANGGDEDSAINGDDDPDSIGHDTDFGMEEGDDDELASVDPSKLQYYMQRLEQLVTDPWGDPAGREALEQAGIKEFVPTKIRDVIGRIDNHFTTYTRQELADSGNSHGIVHWEKGMTHKELDLVEYKGQTYMARKFGDSRQRLDYDTPSVKEPSEDPERWKLEMRGKVLIFCRYTRAVDAVFNGLPPKYKSIAKRFHGSLDGEDKWENLEAFKNDPNIKILIANEQSITEGQNLQMASRIIRVDSPWSPGDYDQSTARIFRPDPAAAKIDESGKPGDMPREVIFIDWMMTMGTSEVAKVARLMWRTVEKVKFDEKGNRRYEDLNQFSLDPISMSLDTLRERSTIEDFQDYFAAKAMLNDIEGNEFSEMRKTTVAAMIPLQAVPAREDFAIMDTVPIVANQRIADPNGFGLERMVDYMAHHTIDNSRTPDQIADMLKGLPTKTEFGNGTIVGVKFKYSKQRDADGNRKLERRPVRQVVVRLAGSEELETFDISHVHIATKLTDKQYDEFFRVEKTWGTAAEKKAMEKEMAAIAEAARKESERREKEEARIKKKAASERSKSKKAAKRKKNIAEGKPINDGVKVVKDSKKMPKAAKDRVTIVKDSGEPKADRRLRIIPSVYDGFVAIHANLRDPDAHDMRQFGFVPFGEYLYIESNRYERFWTIVEWLEAEASKMGAKLDRKSEQRLETIQEAFEDRKQMGFNARLASKIQSELPQFHRQRHLEAKDRKTIKVYPVVLADRVRLAIDLRTSPLARKWLDRAVAGASAKWKHHEGMNIYFANNKTEAKRKMKELIEKGYTITNVDKALDSIAQMKLVRAAKK